MDSYEPKIHSAGLFDSRRRFHDIRETEERTVVHYEAELFTDDGGVAYIGGEAHDIKRGNILLAKPGDVRHSRLPFSARFLHFDPGHPAMEDMLCRLPSFFEGDLTDRFLPLFLAAEECTRSDDRATVVRRIRTVAELTLALDSLASRAAERPSAVAAAAAYMEEHYAEDIGMERLAELCHMSLTHFHRRFLAERNTTPNKYLTDIRLGAAKRLLSEESASLTEIAYLCGFSSQAYFTACFHRHVGLTPTEYREKTAYRL